MFGTLKGIIWYQGETDYTDKDYLPKLVQFVKDLRATLNVPTMPFINSNQTSPAFFIENEIVTY